MTLNRYAKQRDLNEGDIVKRIVAEGWKWKQLDVPCDGIAARRGFPFNHLLEIKNPDGRGNRLTDDQVGFRLDWPGCIHTVETPDEAVMALRQCEEER